MENFAKKLQIILNIIFAIEDEYEDDDHGDNVVEHPGPTFSPTEPQIIEIEEKVSDPDPSPPSGDSPLVPFIQSGSSNYEEAISSSTDEELIQTTTYPVFDEEPQPSPSTTSTSTSTVPSTSTSTSATEEASSQAPLPSATPTFLPPHQRPVRSDLASMPVAKGTEFQIGNLTVYESPATNQTFDGAMLISIHDIFGFHPHVKYISDRLAEFGLRTVVPDFFHGEPVPVENFPPPK